MGIINRRNIEMIKDSLVKSLPLNIFSGNLFDERLVVENSNINSTSGDFTSTSTRDRSALIPVSHNTIYTRSHIISGETNANRVHFYDSSKNWIGSTFSLYEEDNELTFVTPEGCQFIALVVRVSNNSIAGDLSIRGKSTVNEVIEKTDLINKSVNDTRASIEYVSPNKKGHLRVSTRKEIGPYRQISTVDFSKIFESTEDWEDGVDINDSLGLTSLKNDTSNTLIGKSYHFEEPVKITNKAAYLRMFIINDNPEGTHRYLIRIYTPTGDFLELQGVSNAQKHINGYYDYPIERTKLQGSGTPDIFNDGISEVRILLENKNNETVNLTFGKLEFIQRKPFIHVHLDAPRLAAIYDTAPLLTANNIPFTVSIQRRHFEAYAQGGDVRPSGSATLNEMLNLVNNHDCYPSIHIQSNRFPPSPIVTQSGDANNPEKTAFNFYRDLFSLGQTNKQMLAGKYILFSSPSTDYYAWFNDGSESDPEVTGRTGIEVDISQISTDEVEDYAEALRSTIDGMTEFSATRTVTDDGMDTDINYQRVEITNAVNGSPQSTPESGTAPFGDEGFERTMQRCLKIGNQSGLFKNGYLFNAWNTGHAVTERRHAIGVAHSSLLRRVRDNTHSVWRTNIATQEPLLSSKVSVNSGYTYINQLNSRYRHGVVNLDSEFTYEEISQVFEDLINNQLCLSIYTHGSPDFGGSTTTTWDTLYNFFRALSEYRGRIDVLSPKDISIMHDEINIPAPEGYNLGDDRITPPMWYTLDEDNVL